MIITISGSRRFEALMHAEYNRLSNLGHIVLLPVFGNRVHDAVWYHRLHCLKIDMSDCIYVVDKDGYCGDSTNQEIQYAKSIGKPVYYLSKGDLA